MEYITDEIFEQSTGRKVIHTYPELHRTDQVVGVANELLPGAVAERIKEYPKLHLKPEDFGQAVVFTNETWDGIPVYTFQVHATTPDGLIVAWVQMAQEKQD